MHMDIAGRIKKFRSEEKLTQARLAELLNVSRQTVGAWERGSRGARCPMWRCCAA